MPNIMIKCPILKVPVSTGLTTEAILFESLPTDFEPVSDIDTAVADSPKVLDLKRPIREADISN
jgi:hypothetical protein